MFQNISQILKKSYSFNDSKGRGMALSCIKKNCQRYQSYTSWTFLGLLTDGGSTKSPLPKIWHSYPTMMKLGTVNLT